MSTEERKIQVIFKFDDKRVYQTEILSKLRMKNLKRILISMANLANRNFILFQNDKLISDAYNEHKVDELFPNQSQIVFRVVEKEYKKPDLLEKVSVKQGALCSEHEYKYLYLYCYDCNKSICSLCVKDNHFNHSILDKHDYLQNSEFLINALFQDLDRTVNLITGNKYVGIENLRSKLTNIFLPKIQEELKKIEQKVTDIIEFYINSYETSKKILKENVDIMKESYTNGLEELKYQIDIKDIMIDQEVFNLFDEKIKEINQSKLKFIQMPKFEAMAKISIDVNSKIELIIQSIIASLQREIVPLSLNEERGMINENTLKRVNEDDMYELVFSINKSNSFLKEQRTKVENTAVMSEKSSRKASQTSERAKKKEEQVDSFFTNNQIIEQETSKNKSIFEEEAIIIDESILKRIAPDTPVKDQKKDIIIENEKILIEEKDDSVKDNKNELKEIQDNKSETSQKMKTIEESKKSEIMIIDDLIEKNKAFIKDSTMLLIKENEKTVVPEQSDTNKQTSNENQNKQIEESLKKTSPSKSSVEENKTEPINESKKTKQIEHTRQMSIVMKCIPGTNQLYIYRDDLETKIIQKEIDVNKLISLKQFYEGSSWVNHQYKLFVTGGEQNGEITNVFYCYDYKNDKLIRYANMKNCRSMHSSIINNNFLYVVGGKNCNQCEKFDYKLQMWVDMPAQREKERINPILYYHKQSNFLYCFFGMNSKNEFVSTVERIRADAPRAKWEIVPYKNNTNADILRIRCGVVDKEDRIIFVGGIGKDEVKKSIIYYDISTFSFSEMEHNSEEDNCVFTDTNLIQLNDNYYGNFNRDMDFMKFKFDD